MLDPAYSSHLLLYDSNYTVYLYYVYSNMSESKS